MPKGKNKKVIRLIKDRLGRKIMTRYIGLRAKTYSYLIDDSSEEITERCVIKRTLKFENCKNCLGATQL